MWERLSGREAVLVGNENRGWKAAPYINLADLSLIYFKCKQL